LGKSVLELQRVSKCYHREPAVQDVSLRIGEGETVAVIGPSGCGKSTLIRLMHRQLAPDSGTVNFMNRELMAESAPLLRRKMGYVIQDGGLFPHLTAHGNITLMARHIGWRPGQLHERVADLAELTQFLSSGLGRYPAQL
jgi:osmoprotectant transport system ATP-binding protein